MSETLDPEMRADEMRLHMGELTSGEVRVARAAISWANASFKSALIETLENTRLPSNMSGKLGNHFFDEKSYNAAIDAAIEKIKEMR